ncbi:hypothetical protein J4E85_010206 [Alternaria conjuncta]|uniref:uncharacterized protein n=1 Tax=Alternaria conjuncta TaxID=181017 RepID=UPI00221ECD51|nr:uncharacterized protein J4E85_010206 [Alternaria conjuncta]KAI4916550.1 hypothetical protein J4E85_010206 [Alternaria conjuncta]
MRLRNFVRHARVTRNPRLSVFSNSKPYQYERLPSPTCIRLLELLPVTSNGIIRCSLKVTELADAPSFKALSYTWGSPQASSISGTSRQYEVGLKPASKDAVESTRHHTIICDGCLLKVTSNLRDALQMLSNAINMPHMPKTPTYYWIDLLCMNQTDIEERNAQVARMGDVFKRADGVVVWLGKEDQYTLDAVTTMQKIAAIPEKHWPLVPYTSFYNPEESQLVSSTGLTFYNWLGFIVLINRPWFKRAWVVQEIALGKSALVVCGNKVFPWEILSKTLSFVKLTRWYHHLHADKLKHVKELRKHPGIYKQILKSKLAVGISPLYLNDTRLFASSLIRDDGQATKQPSFRNLLDKHRFSESSDPRDKVYAFLGLANRDYNLSVQEVFTQTTAVLMSSYKNLSWLSHVEDFSQRRTSGLPSWVPDLSVPLQPYPLRYRGPAYWHAAGNRAWRPDVESMKRGLLPVQGHRLDQIDQTSLLIDESEDPPAVWASIVNLALALDLSYPDPGGTGKAPSRVEVLWRTLTTDIYNHTYPAPVKTGELFIDYILNLQIRHRLTPWSSADDFQPHHSPLTESVYPDWRKLLELEPPDSPYSFESYSKRLVAVVESMFNGTYSPIGLAQLQHELDQSAGRQRRLFKTRGGFMGTGARSLRVGDEVWVLYRGGLPFVLRPLPNGRYCLVGESFVYGVMHGEALMMDLRRQNIVLE